MRRHRLVLLFVLYVLLLAGTIFLQSFSVGNPGMRLLVNGSTLLMAAVGLFLFGLIYIGEHREAQQEEKREERQEGQQEPVFDKRVYLDFANAHELTRREAEIGLLVVHGYTNLQIAETLYIAETTVKKHLTHIYEKVEVSGRKEFQQIWQKEMEKVTKDNIQN